MNEVQKKHLPWANREELRDYLYSKSKSSNLKGLEEIHEEE